MDQLPAGAEPGRTDSASARYYQELVEQSAAARRSGDHWKAQQLASAAHKWAMDEGVRLQRLTQAKEEWEQATKQLEQAWDRDRSCATLAEFSERHPEFHRMITRYQTAEERARALEEMVLHPSSYGDKDSGRTLIG